MLAILVASGFTGVNATFQSSLFATCIGHTLAFGSQAKSYMGLVGIFIGVGEIAGSSLMHLRPWIPTTGLITLFGYATALFGAFFCLLMLPPDSPMRDSDQLTYIQPNVLTCILVSVLFGMVDSVWYTQISVLIGHVYRSHEADVPVAFALFLCAQAILAAVTFAYCGSVLLHWHILLYVLWATAGLACFCYAQWTHLQLVHRPRLLVEHEA